MANKRIYVKVDSSFDETGAMMLAFTSNKRRAREKFTPKKYRKE